MAAVQYALNPDGLRIEAAKGMNAVCPSCRCPVHPKCGRIKVHHWAHGTGADCDPWFEGETLWHRAWKELFDRAFVEVPMGPHRADIRTGGGLVVELQNSTISPSEIQARERFYGNMVWVVNAQRFADRFYVLKQMGGGLVCFRWKHMKPSWRFAKKPVFFDFGSLTLNDLLGGRCRESTGFYVKDGHRAYAKTQISRFTGDNRAVADPSLASLPRGVLDCNVLQLNTIYETGSGSARPLSGLELRRRLGLQADVAEPGRRLIMGS